MMHKDLFNSLLCLLFSLLTPQLPTTIPKKVIDSWILQITGNFLQTFDLKMHIPTILPVSIGLTFAASLLLWKAGWAGWLAINLLLLGLIGQAVNRSDASHPLAIKNLMCTNFLVSHLWLNRHANKGKEENPVFKQVWGFSLYYLDNDLELVKPKDPILEVKRYLHHKTDYIIGFTMSQGHQSSADCVPKLYIVNKQVSSQTQGKIASIHKTDTNI